MKVLSLVTVALIGLVLAGVAMGAQSTALLTIPALHIYDKPIGNGYAMLADGPIWDPHVPDRPTPHNAVVIAGHDVTPVPGYGPHGPFYNLVTLKKGYLAEIQWHDMLYIYRIVGDPVYHPASDKHVVAERGIGVAWFYSCWPRYTANGRQWAKAILVSVKKLRGRVSALYATT